MRRNHVAVTTAVAFVVVLMLGTVIASWQAYIANRQKTRAEAAEQRAQVQAENQARLKVQAELQRYVSDIGLAYHRLKEGNLDHAEGILRQHISETPNIDVRSFEWDFLWRLCQGDSILTFPKQDFEARSLAVSPDGTMGATASIDGRAYSAARAGPPAGELILYSTVTNERISTLQRGPKPASCVVFSPDGKTLVAGNYDGSIDLWVGDRFQKRQTLDRSHARAALAIAFSPTGEVFATGGKDQRVMLWKHDDQHFHRMVKGWLLVRGMARFVFGT